MELYENMTLRYRDGIGRCEELAEFQAIYRGLQDRRAAWKERIAAILADGGYTSAALAELCEVTRPAVDKWRAGSIPARRDDFIRIGFAAHYGLEAFDRFLQRYGGYPGLYAKSLEDSVYMFVLRSPALPHTYRFCQETIARIRVRMEEGPAQGGGDGTATLQRKLQHLTTLEELEQFVQDSAASYQSAYARFYANIQAFLDANSLNTLTDKHNLGDLAKNQAWTSSLRRCVSGIRKRTWFPTRQKTIALLLHLNMTLDQIDEALAYARMEPLCAKNPVEGAILFAVEQATVSDAFSADGGELYEYVYDVLTRLGIPDAQKILDINPRQMRENREEAL